MHTGLADDVLASSFGVHVYVGDRVVMEGFLFWFSSCEVTGRSDVGIGCWMFEFFNGWRDGIFFALGWVSDGV